jgi:hypothetical protein
MGTVPSGVIVEQGIVMPDADYRLIRVGSGLQKHGRRMAIVDAADFELVRYINWSLKRAEGGNYYANGSYRGCPVLMHRHILGVTDPGVYVDHRDGFGLHNRRHNLNPTTPRGNAETKKRWAVERSRITGKYEVAVYCAAGMRSVVASFETYAEAHNERYTKAAYWGMWE